MHKTKFQSTTSIRFRRWSRMGYAVFCSLASTISIGTLAVSISDKTQEKSIGSNKSNSVFVIDLNNEETELANDELALDATLQETKATTLIQITSDSAAACGLNFYNIIHQNG